MQQSKLFPNLFKGLRVETLTNSVSLVLVIVFSFGLSNDLDGSSLNGLWGWVEIIYEVAFYWDISRGKDAFVCKKWIELGGTELGMSFGMYNIEGVFESNLPALPFHM